MKGLNLDQLLKRNPKVYSVGIGTTAAVISYGVISYFGLNMWTLCLLMYLYPITSLLVILLLRKPEPEVLTY